MKTTPEIQEEVRHAISNTPDDYLQSNLEMRSVYCGDNSGSRYMLTPPEIHEVLLKAEWTPYPHHNIAEPAVGYRAMVPGVIGIIPLNGLDPKTEVKLEDPKHTGYASAVVVIDNLHLIESRFTTMILGPHEEDNGRNQVWTFHPGPPIRPSQIAWEDTFNGNTYTAESVMALGFDYAKVRTSLKGGKL